jgi:NAD(P)-dependent dehydrogenase (short-subunit alcohol dehydrogenase family)
MRTQRLNHQPLEVIMGRLDGKVLLLSGGGADGPPKPDETVAMGNGRAIAIMAAREGAAVMVVDRALESAARTAEMIRAEGGRAEAFAADVREEEACRGAVAATVKAFGALHLLVNNVGIAIGHTLQSPTAEFDTTMDVNVRGHLFMMRYAIPEMVNAGGGAIVNISSVSAVRGGGVAYATSKAALSGLSRAVALAHAKDCIRVNTLLPGAINSAMVRRLAGDREAQVAPHIPMGRQGTPWEIAKAAVFLLSDDASYITAIELLGDGGVTARLAYA